MPRVCVEIVAASLCWVNWFVYIYRVMRDSVRESRREKALESFSNKLFYLSIIIPNEDYCLDKWLGNILQGVHGMREA